MALAAACNGRITAALCGPCVDCNLNAGSADSGLCWRGIVGAGGLSDHVLGALQHAHCHTHTLFCLV